MADYLYRRNTVLEALRAGRRPLHRLWLQKGLPEKELAAQLALASARALPLQWADKAQLTRLAGDASHQGLVLEAGPYPYSDVETMLALARQRAEPPFLLLLDLLHGPHNVGSLLRTAEAVAVHGVIIQDRRAPEITPQTVIYSAGAAEHLHVAQVTNLAQTLQELKQRGVWIVGLDPDDEARPLGQVDLNMAVGLVVGHEGGGLRRLVRQRCDILLRLPMRGHVESLNAATTGSIALYAAWQARGFPAAPPGVGP